MQLLLPKKAAYRRGVCLGHLFEGELKFAVSHSAASPKQKRTESAFPKALEPFYVVARLFPNVFGR